MYTIGRLARKARVKADSIRFYERQGLISAESKTPAGYRLYGDAAVRRLLVIKHAQRCGFTLAEIGKLLDLDHATAASRAATFRMLAEKKNDIDNAIDALQAMRDALGALLDAKDRASSDLRALAENLLLDTLNARRAAPARNAHSASASGSTGLLVAVR
jgi:MerR family Zn(II)-responsive transcriptional regulator of zntA